MLTERAYPKRLAFNYLEELQKEFNLLYASEVDSATRPYAFIKFDSFIQKTKKLYMDTRAQRNVNKLNEDLADVQKIMMTNIHEVLGRGERLDSARTMRRPRRRLAWPHWQTALRVPPWFVEPHMCALRVHDSRPGRCCVRRRDEALWQAARWRARVREAGEIPQYTDAPAQIWACRIDCLACVCAPVLEIPMSHL